MFTKFFIVIAIWWLMFTLSLLQMAPFKYIGMVFNLIQGPLIFCVAMCRTRVAFLFKKYFCEDVCCFKCKSDEFIDEECQELSTIDRLKSKENQEEIREFLQPFLNGNASSNDKEMSKSLYNVRNREPGKTTINWMIYIENFEWKLSLFAGSWIRDWKIWYYRLWSFQGRDTKLERFLHKNQL